MQNTILRKAISDFGAATGLLLNVELDAFSFEIGGVGTVDIAATLDGESLILRAEVMRPTTLDGILQRALELNARPGLLAGGALGYEPAETRIVLTRMIPARICAQESLRDIIIDFCGAVLVLRDRLLQPAADAPATAAEDPRDFVFLQP